MVEHVDGEALEVALIIGDLRDDVDATHPFCDIGLLLELCCKKFFSKDNHTLYLAVDLQVVSRDLVPAEVSLSFQRVVKHR